MARITGLGALAALVVAPLGALATTPQLGASGTAQRATSLGVRIVAVQYHPVCDAHGGADHATCSDGGTAELDGEWVELANTGGAAKMAGWTLTDAHHGNVYHFANYRFTHDGLVRIHTGPGHSGVHDLYWGMKHDVWDDHGDTVTLRSASGAVVQSFHYAGGHSIAWCSGYHSSGSGPWGPGTGVSCPGSTMPDHGSGGMHGLSRTTL